MGVVRQENEIACTVCGTSIYLAPEVFEGQIYNSKADMYSFGYALWELWYGETAFEAALTSRSEHKLLEEVTKRDLRPTHIRETLHPWGIWQHVMTSCWNKEPSSRLTARKSLQCLERVRDGGSFTQKAPPSAPQRSSTRHLVSRRKINETKSSNEEDGFPVRFGPHDKQ